jgi:hypothetical protein
MSLGKQTNIVEIGELQLLYLGDASDTLTLIFFPFLVMLLL